MVGAHGDPAGKTTITPIPSGCPHCVSAAHRQRAVKGTMFGIPEIRNSKTPAFMRRSGHKGYREPPLTRGSPTLRLGIPAHSTRSARNFAATPKSQLLMGE